jgi:DNA/RNA endonuclease G (NUC1)
VFGSKQFSGGTTLVNYQHDERLRVMGTIQTPDVRTEAGLQHGHASVKQVERETELNFLSNVQPQVQQIIESKVDSQ